MKNWLDFLNTDQKRGVKKNNICLIGKSGTGKSKALIYKIIYLLEESKVIPDNICIFVPYLINIKKLRSELSVFIGNDIEKLSIYTYVSFISEFFLKENRLKLIYSIYELYDTFQFLNISDFSIEFLKIIERFYLSNGNIKGLPEDFDSKRKILEELLEKHNIVLPYMALYMALNSDWDFSLKCEYIIADCLEDITPVEYEILKKISKDKKKWFTISPEFCVLPEQEISINESNKKMIEHIDEKEFILCAAGDGRIVYNGKVLSLNKNTYSGKIIKITTKSGYNVRVTPNHIMFARLSNTSGYHVGLIKTSNKAWLSIVEEDLKYKEKYFFGNITYQIYFLKNFKKKENALEFLIYLSCKYGIPIFSLAKPLDNLKDLNLYKQLEIDRRIQELVNSFLIFEEYPHILFTNNKRLTITFFGGELNSNGNFHSIKIVSNSPKSNIKLSPSYKGYWYLETEKQNIEEALGFIKTISSVEELEIISLIKATSGESFRFLPASHLHVGMWIPVFVGQHIKEDVIESIEWEDYKGNVYDLYIPEYSNFIVNNILVHNSSPKRLGIPQNILENIKNDFSLEFFYLNENMRSDSDILKICDNFSSDKKSNVKLEVYELNDEHDEVNFIIDRIQNTIFNEGKAYADFGIFFRLPSQAKVLEEQLSKRGIPYRAIRNDNYFNLSEIFNILAYLKLAINPDNDLAVKRIINVPRRGIGKKTILLIEEYQNKNNVSFFEALCKVSKVDNFPQRFVNQVKGFEALIKDILNKVRFNSDLNIIDYIIEKSRITSEFSKFNTNKALISLNNIKEFSNKIKEELSYYNISNLYDMLIFLGMREPIEDYKEENVILLCPFEYIVDFEVPIAFITGLEDNLVPYHGSKSEIFERDLFLNAMSKVKSRIIFLYSKYRRLANESPSGKISPFLDKCGNVKSSIENTGKPKSKLSFFKKGKKDNIKIGDIVTHKMWGRGRVISIDGKGENAMIAIEFENVGERKLLLKFAPLKKVK